MIENIKEAKELLQKYRSITLNELKESLKDGDDIIAKSLSRITGFGSSSSCTLCRSLDDSSDFSCRLCSSCVWKSLSISKKYGYYCIASYQIRNKIDDQVRKTYRDIEYSENLEELLNSIKSRADLLEKAIEASELSNKKEEYENRRKGFFIRNFQRFWKFLGSIFQEDSK